MRKITLIVSLIFIVVFVSKAQILQEDFATLTSGDNTTTSGSATAWAGDTNFPTVSSAYQAGGAVKLGTSSKVGSIISKVLDLSVNGGKFNVSFDVKGWTTVEGSIKVTVTGLTAQTVTYTATSSATAFENKVLAFTGGTANSTVTIETTAKRAYIDNVNVYISCTASNIAFATPTITKITGAATFTQTPTSLNTTSPFTYASSATGVATVNATTGLVTIVGIGTSTITASQVTDGTYCTSSATYTLNVTAPPTLSVTDITNPSLTADAGKTVSQVVNISGVNLSTDLGLAITGTNASLFSLSQYSITQTGGNVPNTSVTITYSPTAVGNHSATLTMVSTGAIDLSRTLTGTSTLASGLNELVNPLNVYVENKNILFNANAGETIDIYNTIGQKLVHGFTVEGLNSVPMTGQGVMLVRVGNRTAKVIL